MDNHFKSAGSTSFYSQMLLTGTPAPTTTQQAGLTWNGTAWVSTSSNNQQVPMAGQYSSYTHAAQQSKQPSTNPSDLAKYRFYYKQAQDLRQAAVVFGIPQAEKEELLRKAKWSEYYSSLAYYGSPVPEIPQPTSPVKHDIPDSLKRYVQAMLQKCSTDEERRRAQDMVQRVIQNAVKTNTLWTTNWDDHIAPQAQSLSSPPQTATNPPPVIQETASPPPDTSASTTVSPTLSLTKSPKQGKKSKASNDVSYYGPADVLVDTVPVLPKKKLKASDFSAEGKLAARANRFSSDLNKQSTKKASQDVGQQFGQYMGMGVVGGRSTSLSESEYEQMTVKGTCQTLEKEYLRLTAPPKAELVRPQPVLELHLANLKRIWAKRKRDYVWMCSQLKAVRQDLTVQRINNALTIDVYETHARIALEEADLNEYNQCQTQLKELYRNLASDSTALKNLHEFLAYRLIYFVFLTLNQKYEGGSSDLMNMMLSLTPEQKTDRCISHALKVRVAVAEYNYHLFFKLYQNSPKMSGFLLDHMLHPMRFAALQRIIKAYRPSVSLLFVLKELGFDTQDKQEMSVGLDWLKSCGCLITDNDTWLNAKDTVLCESNLKSKTSLI